MQPNRLPQARLEGRVDRVSTIGDRNLRIWLDTYQSRGNRNALIAWHYRTGGDISAWFGEWRPPPQRKPLAA